MAVRSILWLHRALVELRDTNTHERNAHFHQQCIHDHLPAARDPLEQTYLVVQNVGKYFLLPVDHNVEIQKTSTEESITPEIKIKTEVIDDISEESSNESQDDTKPPQIPSGWPLQMPLQLSEFFEHYPNSNRFEQCPTTDKFEQRPTSSIATIGYTNGERTEKVFSCDICTKIFPKKESLRRHMFTHNNERNYECTVCHQLLKTKRTLQLHMILHEDSGKVYECSDCDFMSKRSHSLKRHQIRMHTKCFEYKCHQCPKMFKLNADYNRHMLKHVVSPCRCDVCGKIYQNEFFLRVHKTMGKNRRTACCVRYERIKGGQDASDYTVAKTGKVVVKASTRRPKKQEAKRVFKCPQCKWRFRNWRILHRHMQRHLLSYKCDICGAIFKYKASFLKHKEAHKDDD